jgi:uncharacterized membrane protein
VYLFDTTRTLLESFLTFDISVVFNAAFPLIWVGLGLIMGVIVFAFLLGWLLKRYQRYLYSAILGLLIASPFSIAIEALEDGIFLRLLQQCLCPGFGRNAACQAGLTDADWPLNDDIAVFF